MRLDKTVRVQPEKLVQPTRYGVVIVVLSRERLVLVLVLRVLVGTRIIPALTMTRASVRTRPSRTGGAVVGTLAIRSQIGTGMVGKGHRAGVFHLTIKYG